jgi:hypothetical protein
MGQKESFKTWIITWDFKGQIFHFRGVGTCRATQTRVLQMVCFATMEAVSLLSLETDCRLWIVSLWVEGRYCSFDPLSGFRIFYIAWTIQLFHCIGRPTFIQGHEIFSIHSHEKVADWEFWQKFLRRVRDVGFARKRIEKYVQGGRTMMTLWLCKELSVCAHICLRNLEIVFFRKRHFFAMGRQVMDAHLSP